MLQQRWGRRRPKHQRRQVRCCGVQKVGGKSGSGGKSGKRMAQQEGVGKGKDAAVAEQSRCTGVQQAAGKGQRRGRGRGRGFASGWLLRRAEANAVRMFHVADEQEGGGKPRATMGTGQRYATYRREKERSGSIARYLRIFLITHSLTAKI
jgi:hypothetical protein